VAEGGRLQTGAQVATLWHMHVQLELSLPSEKAPLIGGANHALHLSRERNSHSNEGHQAER